MNKCSTCNALEKMSGNILDEKYFTVLCENIPDALPLPVEKYLVADTESRLLKHMNQDTYVRAYTKNSIYTGKHITTKLWVGDYTTKNTFTDFAKQAEGVKRIAVLRAGYR